MPARGALTSASARLAGLGVGFTTAPDVVHRSHGGAQRTHYAAAVSRP